MDGHRRGDADYLDMKDTGKGFSALDLRRMFDKFYTGDPSRSLDKGHSGLGLYTAQLLITKHGGHIEAGNRVEGGAQVIITVPCKKPEETHHTSLQGFCCNNSINLWNALVLK